MDDPPKPWRDGGLAAFVFGEWIVAYPGEIMFSTVTMYATHMSRDGEWVKIANDEESVVQ